MSDPPTASPADLRRHVTALARAHGFDSVGVTSPDGIGGAGDRLAAALAAGHLADMDWMARTLERRSHPRRLWPEVRSIVMLGMSYGPPRDPLADLSQRSRASISAYARGGDYHDLIKSRLRLVATALQSHAGGDVKIFVDTAPVMEKPLAAAAGLGWQGRHSNLVSRRHGSWLLLGAIMSTADIAIDQPEADHCGTCRRCLDICPTDAFPRPYHLDARRCIAYLTIEHKGHIAPQFRAAIGNRVFGCDDCLAVCPWNKFASAAREARLMARPGSDLPAIAELLKLDDAAFRRRFAGTTIKRTGRDRVVRNAVIAAGNSGDGDLAGPVARLSADPSPLVRAMVAWALPRLAPSQLCDAVRVRALADEADEAVRAEWITSAGPGGTGAPA